MERLDLKLPGKDKKSLKEWAEEEAVSMSLIVRQMIQKERKRRKQ